MPDAGRQIWEVRVPRNVELTLLENRNEQEHNKIVEKKELRKIENKKKRMKNWLSCTWKIRLSLNKSRKPKKMCWKNDNEKLHKHKSFFLQEIALQFR